MSRVWSAKDENDFVAAEQKARKHSLLAQAHLGRLRQLVALRRDVLLHKQRTSSLPKLFQPGKMVTIAGYAFHVGKVVRGDLGFRCDYYDDRIFSVGAEFEYQGHVFQVRRRSEQKTRGRAGSVHIAFTINARPCKGKSCNYVKIG